MDRFLCVSPIGGWQHLYDCPESEAEKWYQIGTPMLTNSVQCKEVVSRPILTGIYQDALKAKKLRQKEFYYLTSSSS